MGLSLDDGWEEVNHGLRLLSEGGGVILPVQGIGSGEGLMGEGAPASLNLTVLIVTDGALGLPQRQLKRFP